MAVIGNTVATLIDVAKTRDPDGKTAKIVEMLNQSNEILSDMVWKEGNLPTGHRTTVRTGLPTAQFRRLNEGVARSKSTLAQVDEGAAMLEGFSEIDRALAVMSGDPGAYRLSESAAFFESMNQTMAQTLFYQDAAVNPAAFTGLTPRFNSLSGTTGAQIYDAGGTGTDNMSIWLVVWGENTVHGIYPKGTKGGLSHTDATSNKERGDDGYAVGDVLYDANNNPYMGYRDHYGWNCGLAVRDWRYVARAANIDVSNQRTFTGAANLIRTMIILRNKVKDLRMGKPVFYMNRIAQTALDIAANEKANVHLQMKEFAGEDVLSFRNIPIRTVDQLLETEARVV